MQQWLLPIRMPLRLAPPRRPIPNAPATPADPNAVAVPADPNAAPPATTAGADPNAAAPADPNAAPGTEAAAPVVQPDDEALKDVQQALAIAPDDPVALRLRGDFYQATGKTAEAIADYQAALAKDPFQSESRDALEKLGQEVPPEQGQPLGEPVADWVVTEPSPGRYVATNPKYKKLRAELEMFGAGKPKIIEWSQMKDSLAGIGLLRYAAGGLGEGTEQELVYTAVIDLYANKVVSIEPYSWGTNTAKWDWQAYSVVVTDPDGNTNELKLRKPRDEAGRARRRRLLRGPLGRPARRAAPARAAAAAEEAVAAEEASSAGSARALPGSDLATKMTLFLASVRDVAEAEIARLAGADIIDLKDPAQGALGAVDSETTRSVVDLIAGRVPVSTTIGDLPMQSEAIRGAVIERAACGVDYVKFGLFPGGDPQACFQALRPIALRVRLILVLFADALPAFDAVAAASDMGAAGIMLDTADKHAGSLLTHLDPSGIDDFVAHAKDAGLDGGSCRLAQSSRRTGAAEPLAGPPRLSRRTLPGAAQRIARSRLLRVHPRPDPAHRAAGGNQAKRKNDRSRRSGVMLGISRFGFDGVPMPTVEERTTRAGRVSTGGTSTDAPYDRVFVHDLVLDAEIGVYTHEKGVTQRARFSVDIEVTPASQAIDDQIERVLDYDTIIATIKTIVAEGHINLVETLADEIATRCLAHPRAASVKVKIEKLDKEPGAVGVEIVRRRERT